MAKATSKKKSAAKKSSAATAKKSAAKKTTKKSAAKGAKKSSTKKGAKKSSTKKQQSDARVLVCASDGECFWTNDGQVLRDLTELRDALKSMKESIFSYHVTKEKNDFADWVEHVLQDASCADALRKARKPNTARTVIVRHLRLYSV